MKIKILSVVFSGLTLFAACVSANAQELAPLQQQQQQASAAEETKSPSSSSLATLPPKPDSAESRNTTTNQIQTNGTYVRPNADKRFKRYVNGVVGPAALARSAATAGVSTAAGNPEEWGKNWSGFGRRFASNLGRGAIRGTTVYALDEALKLDSAFYRSRKKDFGSRFGNAVLSTVTARRPDGRRVVGVPRLVGTYAASVIAYEAWYPKRYGYRDGLRSGTISLGFNAAFNLFREFVWKK